jgi:hypothetical protein
MRGMRCGGGGRGVVPFYRVGEAGRVGNDQRWRCAIKAPVTRRGDDGVATVHGGNGRGGDDASFRFSTWHWRETNGGVRSGGVPESGGSG